MSNEINELEAAEVQQATPPPIQYTGWQGKVADYFNFSQQHTDKHLYNQHIFTPIMLDFMKLMNTHKYLTSNTTVFF